MLYGKYRRQNRRQPLNLVLNLPYYSPPSNQLDAWICAGACAVAAGGAVYALACLPLAEWNPHAWIHALSYEAGQIKTALHLRIPPWLWPWQLAAPLAAALPIIPAAAWGWRLEYRPGFSQETGQRIVAPSELFEGQKDGLALGGAVMSRQDETNGILIAAGQGGGKTVPIFHYIQQAWRRCERALILDGKPEFVASMSNLHGDELGESNSAGSRTWLLALADTRAARWAVGEDVNDRSTAARWATSLTSALSTRSQNGGDFWVEGAQIFIEVAILMCIESYEETWDLGDFATTLHKLIDIEPTALREIVRAYLPGSARLVTAEAEQTLAGFLANLATALRPIDAMVRFEAMKDPATTISIARWLRSRDFLIIGSASTNSRASASFANALIELAAEQLLLKPDADPNDSEAATHLFLDEFGAAGKCDLLRRQMVKFRSKRVRVYLGIQSLQQLQEEYGGEAAQIILGSMDTLLLGRNRGGGKDGDGEWASAQLGVVVGRAYSPGSAVSGQASQYELVERDLVPAAEFGRLGVQYDRPWRNFWRKSPTCVRLIAKSGINAAELVVKFPDKPNLRPPIQTAKLRVDSPTFGRVAASLQTIIDKIEAQKAAEKKTKEKTK